jgi:two-component system, repressor protein LuxO
MSSTDANILIVEDSPTLALTYREYMRPLQLPIHLADTGEKAFKLIEKHNPTVILLDLKLPDMDGIDILKKLNASGSDAGVIVITAHGSVTVAVEAMREGALDFLLKPFNADRIVTTVKNALEMRRLSDLVEQFKDRHSKKFDRFIGESAPMQAVYRMIEDCAPSKASVFIMGQSGTGKELCAEAIHHMGPRKTGRFIALNCAAIPENLMESEIFGHKKGAFTGASADREGAAVAASGGTLFLDEICEMPLDLQTKLLRFIQTGQVVPVGSNTPVDVNVRFVCATNRSPWQEVDAGRFREDLYYRLHVVPIHLPPLKERGQDILAIARHLLKTYAAEENKAFTQIEATAEARLLAHSWPGNVRELGNVIQSTVVLNDGPVLTNGMIARIMGPTASLGTPALHAQQALPSSALNLSGPAFASTPTASAAGPSALDTEIEPMSVYERRLIERAVALSGGRVRKAAKKLGLNPSTVYRKIKEWADSDQQT